MPRGYKACHRHTTCGGMYICKKPVRSGHVSCSVAAGQVAHVSLFNATVCSAHVPGFGGELAPSCPLFARKFGPEVADAVARLMDVSRLLRSPGLLSQMD